MATTLNSLPNEILSLITNHLEHPRHVCHLALTSRRLSEFVKLDGWKAFLRGRFRLGGLDSNASNAVHGLTTLHRNWQRKGFTAKYLEPAVHTKSVNTGQNKIWRGPRGQTMGYQPSIDSYEELFGAWEERREVLAWSAGTQIVFRVKETGRKVHQMLEEERERQPSIESTSGFDAFGHRSSWWTYKVPDSFEGRDDITDLKLLRSYQRDTDIESIAFGTASGRLSLLRADLQQGQSWEQRLQTSNRSVGSLSISTSSHPLLAATLGDTTLALYQIDQDAATQDLIEPLTEVNAIPPGEPNGRTWSCNFLSNEKVALGLGPSCKPIQVYEITPDGLTSTPIRTFSFDSHTGTVVRLSRTRPLHTSVYPLLPIPDTSSSSSGAGNVFLSGGYDGLVRLHDLRSPRGFETMFWDPTNDSSIYSLAMHGLERVVAGVSMHSMIKVFDLRLSGSHSYSTVHLSPKPKKKPLGQDYASNEIVDSVNEHTKTVSGGWNLYLNPRMPPRRNAYREDYWRGGQDSPVYSLSIPSATSPKIYAGLEGAVQSLTFHSIADQHPDPALSQNIVRFPDSGAIDIRKSYDPNGETLNLGMYEQGSDESLGMHLLVQDNVSTSAVKAQAGKNTSRLGELDERWKDIRDEDNRWARGETVSQGAERGRGRGHGRGRGRGGRGRSGNRGRGRGS